MKQYTEIIKLVQESIALSEATMHEAIQTDESGKTPKPVFVKELATEGQEIWKIGSNYYLVVWVHDPRKIRSKKTTRQTEVWKTDETGKQTFSGNELFVLGDWQSAKTIMTAMAKRL